MREATLELVAILASGAAEMNAMAADLINAANALEGQPATDVMRGFAAATGSTR